jgi:hypothetical protein
MNNRNVLFFNNCTSPPYGMKYISYFMFLMETVRMEIISKLMAASSAVHHMEKGPQ